MPLNSGTHFLPRLQKSAAHVQTILVHIKSYLSLHFKEIKPGINAERNLLLLLEREGKSWDVENKLLVDFTILSQLHGKLIYPQRREFLN